MAEPSRTDMPLGSPPMNQREPLPELPETSVVSAPGRSSNASLKRSAEAVGRGVGNAVAGVRSLPQQFDRLRSRIHLVNPPQESPAEVVGEWRDAAESTVSEMAASARRYRYAMAERAERRLEELRRMGRHRLYELRVTTRQRLSQMRDWETERPLQVIAMCAGAAFATGVILRIWRSNSE